MSNYPEGVTGREPAISGYDTRVISVECSSEEVSDVPVALVMNLLSDIEEALNPYGGLYLHRPEHLVREDVAQARRRIREAREALKAAEGERARCGFEGDVEATDEHGLLYWTCPWCGTEHEEILD